MKRRKANNHGKGNVKAQRRNRKINNRGIRRLRDEFLMIDGNFTHFPVAFCSHYDGYITNNMLLRHNCMCKCEGGICPKLEIMKDVAEQITN